MTVANLTQNHAYSRRAIAVRQLGAEAGESATRYSIFVGVGMERREKSLTHRGTARNRFTRKHVGAYVCTLFLDHSESDRTDHRCPPSRGQAG